MKPKKSFALKGNIFITAWSGTCGKKYRNQHLPERQNNNINNELLKKFYNSWFMTSAERLK
jgi:hypothetical protein